MGAQMKEKAVADAACTPPGMPPASNTQFGMIRAFLGRVEKATWGEDEKEQQEATDKLRGFLEEFGSIGLLKTYPYLRLRVHALGVHQYMGTHCLDDAWDAAAQLLDTLSTEKAPAEECAELSISLCLLAGALVYQKRQGQRARQLLA